MSMLSSTLLNQQFQVFFSDSEDNLARAIQECRDYHNNSDTPMPPEWWGQLSQEDKEGLLKDFILNYEGDERDLIWWSGRLRLANELDESNIEPQ